MITSCATILNRIDTCATVSTIQSTCSVITDRIESCANIVSSIAACATIAMTVTTCATILNSGINSEPCPLILCIDGGAADTVSYPPVNGLLNGGSA